MSPPTWIGQVLCAHPALQRSLATACQTAFQTSCPDIPRATTESTVARVGPDLGRALITVDWDVAHQPGLDRADYESELDAATAEAESRGTRVVHVSAWQPRRSQGRGTPGSPTLPSGSLHLRTAPVYGLGDDPITQLLLMQRTLPTVPLLPDTWRTQPVWYEDLARAVSNAAHLERRARTILEVAGPEVVTQQELYDRLARLTDRHPLRIPLPAPLVTGAVDLGHNLGLMSHATWVEAFDEDDGLLADGADVLTRVLGVEPTPLTVGLSRLATELREQTPAEGVGSIEVKRFTAVIHGSHTNAADLLRLVRARFSDVMPIQVGVEPVAPQTVPVLGATLSMALPGRGHVHVRVEDVTDEHLVLATLRGHAVAGFVRFRARDLEDGVLFDVMTCDSAGSALDWLAFSVGSSRLQDANWRTVVDRVVQLSGGTSPGVETDARRLTADEAALVERWIRQVIERRSAPPAP